jgi:hypothetical protein
VLSLLAIIAVDPLLLVGAVLLGLLAILSHLTRRLRGGGAGQGRQTVALTGQHAVHVVEIAGRRLLVGTGPSGAPRVLVELGEVSLHAVEPDSECSASPARSDNPRFARAPRSDSPAARVKPAWAELIERFGGLGGR